MSKKLTIATAALLTAALFGMNASSAHAQRSGGFVSFGNDNFSIALGTGNQWQTVPHRVWRPGFHRIDRVPAVYRTQFDRCGQPFQVIVRRGYDRRVWVAGHYDVVQRRVRVARRPQARLGRGNRIRSDRRRIDNRRSDRRGRVVSRRR